MTDNTKPAKTLTVTVDEQERELILTYGLQDQILRLVKDTNEIGNIFVDPDIRNALIEQVLAERTKSGKIILKKPYDEYDIEIEEVERILDWVVTIVTSFFTRVLANLDQRLQAQNLQTPLPTVTPLTLTPAGSEG